MVPAPTQAAQRLSWWWLRCNKRLYRILTLPYMASLFAALLAYPLLSRPRFDPAHLALHFRPLANASGQLQVRKLSFSYTSDIKFGKGAGDRRGLCGFSLCSDVGTGQCRRQRRLPLVRLPPLQGLPIRRDRQPKKSAVQKDNRVMGTGDAAVSRGEGRSVRLAAHSGLLTLGAVLDFTALAVPTDGSWGSLALCQSSRKRR